MAKKFANRLDFTDLENEMPISDIHVIADMPPSDLLDRR